MNNRHNSFDDLTKLMDTFVDPFLVTNNNRNKQQQQQLQSTTANIFNNNSQNYINFNNNYNQHNNNNLFTSPPLSTPTNHLFGNYNYNTSNTVNNINTNSNNGFSPLSISLDNLINLDTVNCDVNNTIIYDDSFINYTNFYSNSNTTAATTTQTNRNLITPPLTSSQRPVIRSEPVSLPILQDQLATTPTNQTINCTYDKNYYLNYQQQQQQHDQHHNSNTSVNILNTNSSASNTSSSSSSCCSNNYNNVNVIPPLSVLSISPNFSLAASTSPITNINAFINQNSTIKTFLDTERETICLNSSSGLSRSNSQPDLTSAINVEKTPSQLKVRRHPSFSCKTSMSECSEEFYIDLNEINTTADDGIFLGTDAISDFLSGGTFSDILDDLPDLEGLMSVVTFDSTTSWPKHTQCDINLDDTSTTSNVSGDITNAESRITRSAPPSPTPARKKRSQNIQWNKAWSKMSSDEHTSAVECLTRIVNDEMGLREQLEIIRIINPDTKLTPTDTQFVIDLNMIDDEKFRRIKEIIKLHGLKLNEKQISDNCSECSANSCPQGYKMTKRELRLRRAQQRLIKHTQRKESRQMMKESKSGLFDKTVVVPLSQILPEEDIEVDILS